jgi:hypothetical protein
VKIFLLLLLLPFAFTACKKKAINYSSFTLYYKGDSSWTSTDVTTSKQTDGSIIIDATNGATNETVSFTLVDYREGRKTYYIGTGTIPGYSYGSSAYYDSTGYRTTASGGQVAITGYTDHTMDGSFDFVSNKVHLSGSFKAPKP